MSLATDVRSYVADAPKRLAEEAPKPAYAAVGAADLVSDFITKHVETLPADSKARVTKVRSDVNAYVSDVRARIYARVESAKGLKDYDFQAKAKDVRTSYESSLETYRTKVVTRYDDLVARGEAKVSELRNSPRVAKLVDDVEDVVETAQAKVQPVIDQVEAAVKPVVEPVAAAVRPVYGQVEAAVSPLVEQVLTTVKSVAPKSTTTTDAPAAKAAPVRKAAAKRTPAKKAPAKKAAPKA